MFDGRRGTRISALAGAFLLAAAAAGGIFAQEAEAPRLDVDALAEQLALDDEGRTELASLENLLQRRAAMRQGMMQLHTEMRSTMQGLRQRLDPDQRQELMRSLRNSGLMRMERPGGDGTAMGQPGAHMRGGQHMGGDQGMRGGRGMTAPDGRGQRLRMHEPGANPDCPYAPGAQADDSSARGGSR